MGNSKVSGDTGGGQGGRQVQHGQPKAAGSRGSSEQGPRQDAKGAPNGANQGGAPRGSSRLEHSHQREQQRKDRVPQGGTGKDDPKVSGGDEGTRPFKGNTPR